MGFKDAELQSDLYFRTTDEMLEEFSYLGEQRCKDVVIYAPGRIAEMVRDDIKPFPDGTFPPVILSAPDDLRAIVNKTMKEMYEHEGVIPEVRGGRLSGGFERIGRIFAGGDFIRYFGSQSTGPSQKVPEV